MPKWMEFRRVLFRSGRAGRIRRSEDRTEVVRIFDAVQDHDQWRTRGALHEFIKAVVRRIVDVSHHSLMDASTRASREQIRSDVLWPDAMRCGEREQIAHAIVATLGNPQLLHASRAESLDDRVDAVDDHQRQAFNADANAAARSAAPGTGVIPDVPSDAAASIAGTAISSSSPSVSPVSAKRIG